MAPSVKSSNTSIISKKATEHVASRDIDLAAYPFPELLARGEVIAEKSKEDPSIEELTDLIV